MELLSPAKNLECGLAAINSGADAVYIGSEAFGARQSATNSIKDIEKLVEYAHLFRAKIYVTLNTILTDPQIEIAEKLTWQLYNSGVDAIIVQDMGLLECNLPPLPLHASTQTDNRTAKKVNFLHNSGFSRVVLARELNINQIAEIKKETTAELEVFVHGALCVSYSGQCYISEATCGRSANRGACAQFCRLPYDLIDSRGKVLAKHRHLLSLKDLDRSDSLEDLMRLGIASLKIEGRLKDVEYVRNITAYYRQKLDKIIEGNSNYSKDSSGKTLFFFEPNPQKTFNRGKTDYFLYNRKSDILQPASPKSFGEEIGTAELSNKNRIEIRTDKKISNGDGLCFINKNEELQGFLVNRVEGKSIYTKENIDIKKGTQIFRNKDIAFEKILKSKPSVRKIGIEINVCEVEQGIIIELIDEDGVETKIEFAADKQVAKTGKQAEQNLINQLSRLGDTIFEVTKINLNWEKPLFLPNSFVANVRRQAVGEHLKNRTDSYKPPLKPTLMVVPYLSKTIDYTSNVSNLSAHKFYSKRGVEKIEMALEVEPKGNAVLMFCKHCIKHAMGYCHKQGFNKKLSEPLYLRHQKHRFKLKFDCSKCEMMVLKALE